MILPYEEIIRKIRTSESYKALSESKIKKLTKGIPVDSKDLTEQQVKYLISVVGTDPVFDLWLLRAVSQATPSKLALELVGKCQCIQNDNTQLNAVILDLFPLTYSNVDFAEYALRMWYFDAGVLCVLASCLGRRSYTLQISTHKTVLSKLGATFEPNTIPVEVLQALFQTQLI